MTLDAGSGLGADARAIIDAARAEEDPSREDVDRVRGRLFAHLGVAAAGGAAASLVATGVAEGATVGTAAASSAAGATATAVTATSVGAASVAAMKSAGGVATAATGGASLAAATATSGVGLFAKMTMATKVGLAVLALGGAGTAAVVVTTPDGTTAPAASSVEATGDDPPAAAARRSPPPDGSRAAEPGAAEPGPTDVGAAEPGPTDVGTTEPGPTVSDVVDADGIDRGAVVPGSAARSTGAPTSRPRAAADGPGPAEPAADPLAAEAELLGRAQSALAAARHDEALRLLDEHAARFPRGALRQEREAARWLALCGSGRGASVRTAVAAFLAEHPGSPVAARLRAACGVAP